MQLPYIGLLCSERSAHPVWPMTCDVMRSFRNHLLLTTKHTLYYVQASRQLEMWCECSRLRRDHTWTNHVTHRPPHPQSSSFIIPASRHTYTAAAESIAHLHARLPNLSHLGRLVPSQQQETNWWVSHDTSAFSLFRAKKHPPCSCHEAVYNGCTVPDQGGTNTR